MRKAESVIGRLIMLPGLTPLKNFWFCWKLKRSIEEWRPDVIIASLPQIGTLSVVKKIVQSTKAKLVVDFRDVPDEFDPKHLRLDTRRAMRWTRSHIAEAALLVTVSAPLSEMVARGFNRRIVPVIYNGYEGELNCPAVRSLPINKSRVIIFYAGVLSYGRDKSLKTLLDAFDILEQKGYSGADFILRVAGKGTNCMECLKAYEKKGFVELLGSIPREEVIEMQSQASVLLCISSPEVRGVLTSKVFEYLKAFKPIMSIPRDNGVLDEFLLRSKAGCCFSTENEIVNYLLQTREKQMLSGGLFVEPDYNYLKSFSRRYQGKLFYSLIEKTYRGESI